MKSLLHCRLVWGIVPILLFTVDVFATDISGNQSGKLVIGDSPYLVVGNVLVPDGQNLTIEPGVIIKFEQGYIFQVSGTLIAKGTSGNVILFTSNELKQSPGDWGKLYFSESENSQLDYCKIEYAGAGANPSGVNVWKSNVSIKNTTITNTSASGIVISFSSPAITDCSVTQNSGMGIECLDPEATPTIDNCSITNNNGYAISMYANNIQNIGKVRISGIGENSIRVKRAGVDTGTWLNHDVPYVIDGHITVNDGHTLTINTGINLLFNGKYTFEVNGSLVAIGEWNDPITFDSNQPEQSPGDWDKLLFDGSENSKLTYCHIKNGGSNTAAITVLNSNPDLQDVSVFDSAQNGISLSNSSPVVTSVYIRRIGGIGIVSDHSSHPIINGCNIYFCNNYAISMYADNIKNIKPLVEIFGNTFNSIRVEGGLVHTSVWQYYGVPYVINGSVSVADGNTLTINPGNELRFNGDYTFEVNGSLIAEGTNTRNITFTSNKASPSPGDWRTLSFSLSDQSTSLKYCKILYGGSQIAAVTMSLSNPSISNTIIKDNAHHGIYLSNSSPMLRRCTIQSNLGNGLHIQSGQPDLGTKSNPGNNSFGSNLGWDVYNNNNPTTIYAIMNYWGNQDSTTIDATQIYDDDENPSKGSVIFVPLLTSIPTGVEEDILNGIPAQFLIHQNYPNPFNPTTTIKYKITENSHVKLVIYDILGREVAVLTDTFLTAGFHETVWDGSNHRGETAGSGVYIYQLIAGSNRSQGKLMFLR